MFEGKYFLFTLEKGIGVLTLNRPPYNIFEAGYYVELGEVEDVIAAAEGIRCLVIKANGKCFPALYGVVEIVRKAVHRRLGIDRDRDDLQIAERTLAGAFRSVAAPCPYLADQLRLARDHRSGL